MIVLVLLSVLTGAELESGAIELPACRAEWLDPAELDRLLRVELERASVSRLRIVVVDCERTPEIFSLVLELAASSRVVERTVSLSDVRGEARVRTLALAIGEMLRDPAPITPMPTSPPPPSPAPAIEPSPPPASQARPGALVLGAGARVDVIPAEDVALFGATLGVELDVGGGRFAIDAGAAVGSVEHALGRIHVGLISGGATFLVNTTGDRVLVAVGPRLEAGLAWVSGAANGAASLEGDGRAVVMAAGARGLMRVRLGGDLSLALQLDGAVVLTGIHARAGGDEVTGISGGVLGSALRLEHAW